MAERPTPPENHGQAGGNPGASQRASFAQRRLWFLYQLSPDRSDYNINSAWLIDGPLDRDALVSALDTIVNRHEALRTVFELVDGELYQKILEPSGIVHADAEDGDLESAERRAGAFALQSFDLAEGLPIRSLLIRVAEEQHILAVSLHHIVFDGWSSTVFNTELATCYEALTAGGDPALEPLECQYRDYSAEQHATIENGSYDSQLEYWREELTGVEPLALPTDGVAVPGAATGNQTRPLTERVNRYLTALVKSERVSPYMVHLAATMCVLARYTGQTDIAVGTVMAGRMSKRFEPLIGFFVNTLVMRTDLAGDPTFRDSVGRVRNTVLSAFMNQDLPFDRLVEEVNPERGHGDIPLFRVMFLFEQHGSEHLDLNGLGIRRLRLEPGAAKFDLIIRIKQHPDSAVIDLDYREGLFDATRMEAMTGHYSALLEDASRNPDHRISELGLLSAEEIRRFAKQANGTGRPYDSTEDIAHAFARIVNSAPDRTAVVCADRKITYAELDAGSSRLAQRLSAAGIGAGHRVAVCLGRSVEFVESVLAIIKSGACYVPVDPAYPAERVRYMLEDCGAKLAVVGQNSTESPLPIPAVNVHDTVTLPDDSPGVSTPCDPSALAYIVYTSGSTGQPKGVAIEQRNVLRLVCGGDYVDFHPDHAFMLLAPVSFDASTFELWGPLLNGCKLVVYPHARIEPAELGQHLRDHRVTTLWLTASIFNQIIETCPEILQGVKELITGGEALSVSHVQSALAALPDTRMVNGYGPTECTTFACTWPIPEELPPGTTRIPIGRPIAETSVAVLDKDGNLCPVGIAGELFIGGDGVARGYHGRDSLTAEKFVFRQGPDGSRQRYYRSGDKVAWRSDGTLDFLGRFDDQVKIRGHRIEPGEVEAVAASCPAVTRCAILAEPDAHDDLQLTAYVTGDDTGTIVRALRSYLATRLPRYMLPSKIHVLTRMPIGPNGKVDRGRLPELISDASSPVLQLPDSQMEMQLLGVWQQVLGHERFGVTDDFFEIGGHSLLAVRLVGEIQNRIGRAVPLAELFENSNIRDLAGRLENHETESRFNALVPLRNVPGPLPLFCIHTRSIADHLDDDQPAYWLNHLHSGRVPDDARVESVAAAYLSEMRQVQPHGPYAVCGFSFGGMVAFEIAVQLLEQGEKVAFLGLMDATAPGAGADGTMEAVGEPAETPSSRRSANGKRMSGARLIRGVKRRIRNAKTLCGITWNRLRRQPLRPGQILFLHVLLFVKAAARYRYQSIDCNVDLFLPAKQSEASTRRVSAWRALLGERLILREVEGAEYHLDLIREPHIRTLARQVQNCLIAARPPNR